MPARRRVKADWVYRANARSNTPLTGTDLLGTYDPLVRALGTGTAEANALVLYDSSNYVRTITPGSAGLGSLPSAARVEGKKASVRAVEGTLYVEPSTWAVGNLIALGIRIGIYEQDYGGGSARVITEMSMFNNNLQWTPALGANNGRENMREWRIFEGFQENSAVFSYRLRWKGKRSLAPNEGLFLWLEGEETSVNIRYQTWFRSLIVADE